YFSLVRDYEIDKGYIYSSCFSVPEFSEEESKLRQILLKKGFQPANSNIQPKLYGCGAVSPNSILVEPDGTLQKCWNVVGDKNEAIGNIMDIDDEFNGTLQELINESKWYAWSEFENEDCKNCEVLPLCMGGCPYYAVKRNELFEKYHYRCTSEKYNLKNVLQELAEEYINENLYKNEE
ncbi:SPASM domain-containing protein, partial [Dorea sp. MB18-49]